MQASKEPLLPEEQMEAQIAQIDLLLGTYPGDDEVTIDTTTRHQLEILRDWALDEGTAENDAAVLATIPSTLSIDVNVAVDLSRQSENGESIRQQSTALQLSVEVPVRVVRPEAEAISGPGSGDIHDLSDGLPPPFRIRLRQPSWMNRTDTAKINSDIARDHAEEDFVSIIERFCEEASKHHANSYTSRNVLVDGTIVSTTTTTSSTTNPTTTPTAPPHPTLHRTWFYFPSLSTRSKRNDLVHHAPLYSLTGFVLAGKPGILCLEGTSANVDAYMRFIKTQSWGDIPSHQKKVSERYRETIREAERVFTGMSEVTDEAFMGEKRGERGNRGDLRALEAWLDGLGLRGVLGRVLF